MKIHPQNVIINFRNNEEKMCRICYEIDEHESLLISPCACSGTMAYIHDHCLKKWIRVKNIPFENYKCEQCRKGLTIRKLYPEETFKLQLFYKHFLNYIVEFFFLLIFIYCISYGIYALDKQNNYKSVDILDNHKDKILLRIVKNKMGIYNGFYVFYYYSFTTYLLYMGFYLMSISINLYKINRKCLFFKLNMINLFCYILGSSSFFIFYILYACIGDIASAEIFVYMSAIISIFINWGLVRMYGYTNNIIIDLMNNKYNIIEILDVTYNPLARRFLRN
jgi:hypothetical protein